ncbi:MAG: alpha/beta hydrolase family protein [Acidothermaceae bacterium]
MPSRKAHALLVVGHGAGGDIEAPDLLALRDAAIARGIAVARVRQPYRVAGRRAPAPAVQLDAAWVGVVAAFADSAGPFEPYRRRLRGRPLIVAGRSSGARVACRTAQACGAAGIVALAFPLRPPGRPDRSRADELAVSVPLLVVQGSRDAFGRPAEFPSSVTVIEAVGADHSLKAPGFRAVVGEIADWIVQATDRESGPVAGRYPS